jgi:hypothetical protein
MEITEKVIQIPLEDLNYAQLKDVTREEILSFLISKKERILLLARKLEESEKIKNRISARLCQDFGDLISPDYIIECLPDIYKEKSKARSRCNRLAWFSPAKITRYDNKLIEEEIDVMKSRFYAAIYLKFNKDLVQELVELEDNHQECQYYKDCIERRLRESELQIIELMQQQEQTKGLHAIQIPTIIWRQLQSMKSSGMTYANILVEDGNTSH